MFFLITEFPKTADTIETPSNTIEPAIKYAWLPVIIYESLKYLDGRINTPVYAT